MENGAWFKSRKQILNNNSEFFMESHKFLLICIPNCLVIQKQEDTQVTARAYYANVFDTISLEQDVIFIKENGVWKLSFQDKL